VLLIWDNSIALHGNSTGNYGDYFPLSEFQHSEGFLNVLNWLLYIFSLKLHVSMYTGIEIISSLKVQTSNMKMCMSKLCK
jgi:hypothetical protein